MHKDKHIRFDWAVKRLLRQKANFVILEGFLSELLFEDVKIQEIIESEGNQKDKTDKFNRVDILVKDKNDNLILIEVQNEKEDDYFHRMNYSQAKLISEHIHSGDKYGKIKKVISINIVYFELGHGNDYIYRGETIFEGLHKKDILHLSKKQKRLYSKNMPGEIFTVYYVIKVNKFDAKSLDPLDEWIYFLKNSEIPDDFKAKGLEEAKEVLRIDKMTDTEKEEYENYIKTERIRESEINTAHSDGFIEAENKFIPLIEKEKKKKEKAQHEKEQERLEKEKAQHEKEQERLEKEQAQNEKEQERLEKEKAQHEKEQERLEKEQAQQEKQQTLTSSIIALYKKEFSAKEIADVLNLEFNTVIAIIKKIDSKK